MKITFFRCGTRSYGQLYANRNERKNILVDCGMEQGADIFENQEIPVNPNDIECVLLTHARYLTIRVICRYFTKTVFAVKFTRRMKHPIYAK